MQLRKLIDSSCGLRFMIDNLCTHSSYSRKLLLESKMLYDKTTIQKSYSVLKEFYKVVENDENKNIFRLINVGMVARKKENLISL